jgi:hypothetical protein
MDMCLYESFSVFWLEELTLEDCPSLLDIHLYIRVCITVFVPFLWTENVQLPCVFSATNDDVLVTESYRDFVTERVHVNPDASVHNSTN